MVALLLATASAGAEGPRVPLEWRALVNDDLEVTFEGKLSGEDVDLPLSPQAKAAGLSCRLSATSMLAKAGAEFRFLNCFRDGEPIFDSQLVCYQRDGLWAEFGLHWKRETGKPARTQISVLCAKKQPAPPAAPVR
jgi:hypothetical protein